MPRDHQPLGLSFGCAMLVVANVAIPRFQLIEIHSDFPLQHHLGVDKLRMNLIELVLWKWTLGLSLLLCFHVFCTRPLLATDLYLFVLATPPAII